MYAGFTGIDAKYGDTLLAVSTIMMKLMLLYSYFIDGFAYAGEALSGRYIGCLLFPWPDVKKRSFGQGSLKSFNNFEKDLSKIWHEKLLNLYFFLFDKYTF